MPIRWSVPSLAALRPLPFAIAVVRAQAACYMTRRVAPTFVMRLLMYASLGGWGVVSPNLVRAQGIGGIIKDALGGRSGVTEILADRAIGPVLDELLNFERQPVTTSFANVRAGTPLPRGIEPRAFTSMRGLPRAANGGYVLHRAGAYELAVQSYCMRAGTHGPSRGQGYLPAPVSGPKAATVQRILTEAAYHPEVAQRDIQVLLWAILARTEWKKLPRDVQETAAALLGPGDLSALKGGLLAYVPDKYEARFRAKYQERVRALARPLQKIALAEQDMRERLARSATYEELEEIAVLTGVMPEEASTSAVPSGRWARHPDGYYVRYQPSGYSRTLVQVYAPEDAVAGAGPGGLAVDLTTDLAMPAATGAQRLAITNREQDGGAPPAKYTNAKNACGKNDPDDATLDQQREALSGIMDHASEIKRAAAAYNVDPRVVAGAIYAERARNYNYWSDDVLQPALASWVLTRSPISLGFGQVSLATAELVENAGLIPTPPTTHDERVAALIDPAKNIQYAAAYIKYLSDKFPEANGDPALLMNLYEIGEKDKKTGKRRTIKGEYDCFAAEGLSLFPALDELFAQTR
jgi:hypothetical protein